MSDLDIEHYDMVKPRFRDLRLGTTKESKVYRWSFERELAGLQPYLRVESTRCVGFAIILLSLLCHTLSDNLSAKPNNRTPLRPKAATDSAENRQEAAFQEPLGRSLR